MPLTGLSPLVFLEAIQQGVLPTDFAELIWNEAVAEGLDGNIEGLMPDEVIMRQFIKAADEPYGTLANLHSRENSRFPDKAPGYSFPARIAVFKSAADALTFHEILQEKIEQVDGPYALRQGALLKNSNGLTCNLGFQL